MQSKNNNIVSLTKDYFITRNGVHYAGTHLLVDLWGANKTDDMSIVEKAIHDCITACEATLLHIQLHHFTSSGGISGIALLAESHISVHTWPERNYAAFDIFMCGNAKPENALPVLKRAFSPKRFEVKEILRGKAEK